MKKLTILVILLSVFTFQSFGQRYLTRNGNIRFFSATPVENIEAYNNQATCIVDTQTGEVVSKVLMKAFVFDKALMQEHFNENYVESDKYPQAVLKANIKNLLEIDAQRSEKQNVLLDGELTIHGVSKKIEIKGTIEKTNEQWIAQSTFIIKPSDYDIKIPKVVEKNIAREIEVTLKFNLEPMKTN